MSGTRRFVLERSEDVTGISGTGAVVEGLQFSDGSVALRWLSTHSSIAIYRSIEDVEIIHGHNGATVVKWIDQDATS
jgi:hypothetical protein